MTHGWEIRPLGEICEVLDSLRKPVTKKDRRAGPYPYYGATGIVDFVDDFLFDEPLVLVGEDGAKWGSGNATAFAVSGKCWVNNHAHVIRPLRTKVLDEWIVHYLAHTDLTFFVSGLTVPKLNQGSLREIPVPLPPISEQRRIVEILDQAFEAIAVANKKVEKNLQNVSTLFGRFLDRMYLEGDALGWPLRQLGEVFEIGSSKRIHEREWSPSGVPFYGGKEIVQLAKFGRAVSNAYISEEKYSEYAAKIDMPKAGDLLITARGTIGVGYIVQDTDKFYYKDGNIISMRAKEEVNADFILDAFRSNAFSDQLSELTGATVTHLPLEKAKRLRLRLPPPDIQEALVAQTTLFKDEIRQLNSAYKRKVAALDELKKSLLHHAFTGQLTPKKADQLVEAVA